MNHPSNLRPRFEVKNPGSNDASLDILSCTTRTFYGQLLADKKTIIFALDYRKETLHAEPTFNAKQ